MENSKTTKIVKYYKVYYTTQLNKKHKTFQDGYLRITNGKKAILMNEDGKEVSKTSSYEQFYSEDRDVQSAYINSFLIEIEDELPADDFISGRCFLGNYQTKPVVLKQIPKMKRKKAISDITKFTHKTISDPDKCIVLCEKGQNEAINTCFIEEFLVEELMPHQREGIKFMFDCVTGIREPGLEGCILADSMGLGKTLQVISLIWTLLTQNPFSSTEPCIKKCVIVTPVSLIDNWCHEISKWLGDTRIKPLVARTDLQSAKSIIVKFVQFEYKIILISYETFVAYSSNFKDACDLLVCDEGHKLKNTEIKSFRALDSFTSKKRIIITGTPIQNNLVELYACISFVYPRKFQNKTNFKNVFEKPIIRGLEKTCSAEEKELAKSRSDELSSIISVFMLGRTQKILEEFLPKRSEHIVCLPPSALQIALYNLALEVHKDLNFDIETNGTGEILSIITVLRKILNHPSLLLTSNTIIGQKVIEKYPTNLPAFLPVSTSPKLVYTIDILKGLPPTAKVIICSYFTSTLTLLNDHIPTLVEFPVAMFQLTGKMSGKERSASIESFSKPCMTSKPQMSILLLAAKAGGTGLNLVCSSNLILYDADWNPSNDAQVMGRIYRKGQTSPCNIYRLLISPSIEDIIHSRQSRKRDLSSLITSSSSLLESTWSLEEKGLLLRRMPASSGALSVVETSVAASLPATSVPPGVANPPVLSRPAPSPQKLNLSEILSFSEKNSEILKNFF